MKKNEISGMNYWDQNSEKYGDDYQYSTIEKNDPDGYKVVSGANPNQ